MADTWSSSMSASSPSDETGVVGTAGAVVAGVDGTEADGPVVDWASDEAARLGAPLRVVTVIDAGVQMTSYEVLASGSPSVEELLRAEVHAVLDGAAARARARHPTLDIAVNAPMESAAGALVRLSEGALRLVVGGPAKGRLEHVLLGSVVLPVVAHAHCPVIVVPVSTVVSAPTRIVVGVDGSDAGRRAVEFAFQSAQLCGAAVTAVLVWHVEVVGGVVVTERSSERWAGVEKRYEALGHRTHRPGSRSASRGRCGDQGPPRSARQGARGGGGRPPGRIGRRRKQGSRGIPRAAARVGEPQGRRTGELPCRRGALTRPSIHRAACRALVPDDARGWMPGGGR